MYETILETIKLTKKSEHLDWDWDSTQFESELELDILDDLFLDDEDCELARKVN